MDKIPERTPIESTALHGWHHDPTSQVMTVRYRDKEGGPGAVWAYDGVGAEKAHTMEHSQSPGSYFTTRIKGVHPGRKLA